MFEIIYRIILTAYFLFFSIVHLKSIIIYQHYDVLSFIILGLMIFMTLMMTVSLTIAIVKYKLREYIEENAYGKWKKVDKND